MVTALLRIEFGQQQRKFHVLKGGEYRNQVERLENVADVRVAPVGRLFVIKAENVLAKHQQLAFGRAVDGGNNVRQCSLPGAGGPHERAKFPPGNLDGHIVKRFSTESTPFDTV